MTGCQPTLISNSQALGPGRVRYVVPSFKYIYMFKWTAPARLALGTLSDKVTAPRVASLPKTGPKTMPKIGQVLDDVLDNFWTNFGDILGALRWLQDGLKMALRWS